MYLIYLVYLIYLIYLLTYRSIYLSVCLSICLSICKLEVAAILRDFLSFEFDNIKNAAIHRDFLVFCTWQHQKQSNSSRLPHFLKLTASKTKQFCDTSFENGKLSAELTALCQCVLRFFQSTCLKYCEWCQVIRSAAPATQKHLSKPEDLMLQNATPLRKSAPGPPNISDKHVSCTAPATENASLQILFKCPTLAIVFGNDTRPSRFAHSWRGAQSLALATRKHIWTSKSAPYPTVFSLLTSKCASRHNSVHFFDISTTKSALNPSVFYTFDFEMCFAPQQRALFRHLNFQNWSEPVVFSAFWLRNVLRATTACKFHLSSGQLAPHPPL